MSAKQSNCSLHEILQTPCGSSRDKESHVSLSECNADISAHLSSCHLSKCGDVTEAELIMARASIRGMSATQLTRITICPRHRHSLGRFWRAPKSCQYPGHTGKITSLAGKHVINFQMADEICFLFGKTITAVGSRKCNFVSNSKITYIHILLFLFATVSRNDAFPSTLPHGHLKFEFSGRVIPIPRSKN